MAENEQLEDLHVIEQGDRWEVWRLGDSMPLGTYATLAAAEEQARAQAAVDGVSVVDHEREIEEPPEV